LDQKHFRRVSLKKTVSRAIAKQAKTVKFHGCPETSIRQSLINHHRSCTNPLPQITAKG
jgi:hypothetical protein